MTREKEHRIHPIMHFILLSTGIVIGGAIGSTETAGFLPSVVGGVGLMYLSQFIGEKMIALVLSVEKHLRHTISNGSE